MERRSSQTSGEDLAMTQPNTRRTSLCLVYIYNISSRVTTVAAAAKLTTEEIQERHMKHIAEISKHLSTEPIQSEDLTFDQQEWLEFRMARPFPKPYRPFKPIVIPYRWQEQEQEEDTKS